MKRSSNTPRITAERDVPGGRRIALELLTKGEPVPAILLLPNAPAQQRVPGVLLLHGYSSSKEQMAESMGRALLRCGVASLALDLPEHGHRRTSEEDLNLRNAIKVAQVWRLANDESHQALRFLAQQSGIDSDRIGMVGYSLGAYLAINVAVDPCVRVVMLAAGGDLPEDMPFVSVVRKFVNPLKAVQKLGGKPLLMVNGSRDAMIKPAQARRLFEAAPEPKQIVWYNGGHWPPAPEVQSAAQWLATVLRDQAPLDRTERTA